MRPMIIIPINVIVIFAAICVFLWPLLYHNAIHRSFLNNKSLFCEITYIFDDLLGILAREFFKNIFFGKGILYDFFENMRSKFSI